jgi:uroporphyrinogen decarboxylase
MKPRERILMALNHEEPDRVPLYVEYTPEAKQKLLRHIGIRDENPSDALLAGLLNHDLITFQIGPVTSYHLSAEPEYVDEWGITWRWVQNPAGSRYTEIAAHPLADCSDPDSIAIPDFSNNERYASCIRLVQDYKKDYAVIGSIVCTLFELSWYLRGMIRVMEDMCLNKDFMHAYLDRLLSWAKTAGSRLAEIGVDIIYLGDDFGSQQKMLISPEMFREFFKPRYADLYATFRRINPNLKIAHHSCGNISPIIKDFVEIGLDILNPVQPLAMDPAALKRQFGDRLTLWGAVDEQRVLPFGTVQDVVDEVKLRLRTLAPGGGFILSPAHNVQSDTSIDNVMALYETAKACGSYPIRL